MLLSLEQLEIIQHCSISQARLMVLLKLTDEGKNRVRGKASVVKWNNPHDAKLELTLTVQAHGQFLMGAADCVAGNEGCRDARKVVAHSVG